MNLQNNVYVDELRSLMKANGLSEPSIKLHISNIKRLYDFTLSKNKNKRYFRNSNFLKDYDTIVSILYKKYDNLNTIKSYISSIIALIETKHHTIPKKTQKKYMDLITELKRQYDTSDKSIKSHKEEQNWITQDEIKNIKNELLEKIDNKHLFTEKQNWNNHLKILLLSLYTDIPPRRNQDYILMKIIDKDFNYDNMNTKYNYIDLENERMIFNKYKTSRTNKQQFLDYSIYHDFKKILNIYLEGYKNLIQKGSNLKDLFLLINDDGTPFKHSNTITRKLNDLFDKNVSSSLLRKIYISNYYGDNLEVLKQMNILAKKMGHSINTSSNIYIKK